MYTLKTEFNLPQEMFEECCVVGASEVLALDNRPTGLGIEHSIRSYYYIVVVIIIISSSNRLDYCNSLLAGLLCGQQLLHYSEYIHTRPHRYSSHAYE